MQTVGTWLASATKKLEKAGIGTARLDSLVLLEDEMNKNSAQLLAHPDIVLKDEQLQRLNSLLTRRLTHEPLAYIRGKTEFYGRTFKVSPAVLEPRPESETMVDLLKRSNPPAGAHIIDVGTGSGALGITAKLEFPNTQVVLVDIDDAALTVAEQNCELHGLLLSCVKDDLLSRSPDIRGTVYILANLPYVPDHYRINLAAGREPALAIFGGPDGLGVYRRLFAQLHGRKWQPLTVFAEALPFQHQALQEIAKRQGFDLAASEGLIQVYRR